MNVIITKCEKCPDLVKSRKQIVNGYGNKHAAVMFIGICPGNHGLLGGADKSGIPFFGDRSGGIFEKMLNAIDMKRTEVYTTNIVKCRPAAPGNLRYNRLPTDKEIENCIPLLVEEIITIKPKLIICLGKIPYTNLFKRGDIKTFVIEYAWHPGFIAREPALFGEWIKDIRFKINHWTKPSLEQTYLDVRCNETRNLA